VVVEEDVRDDASVGATVDPSIPQDEREGVPDERDGVAPLVLREPQDERDGKSSSGHDERDGTPSSGQDERDATPSSGRKRKKRGGGPKTPEGKARVRLNPIKHGVLAQTPVIPLVEREEDWKRLLQSVLDWVQLEGEFAEALGTRAAFLMWRLKRVERYERDYIESYLEDVPQDYQASLQLEGREVPTQPSAKDVREMDRMLSARLIPDDATLDKISRYEARLHRYLWQTLYQISVLKGLKRVGTGHLYGVANLDPPGMGSHAGRQLMPPQKKSFRKELEKGLGDTGASG